MLTVVVVVAPLVMEDTVRFVHSIDQEY